MTRHLAIAGLVGALLALAAPVTAGERLIGCARVTDGDTLKVEGVPVRLKGLAAPELAEPGGAAAKAYMVELVEGQTVVCDLTRERTRGRRVGYCLAAGRDVAEALDRAGLARDCPRYSKGRHAAVEPAAARTLPFPGYCRPR